MSLSDDLYKDIILEHSQSPSHRDPVPDANIVESGVNRSCGDEVELSLKVEGGKIQKIGVKGIGCSISTASSSLMADAVEGMDVEKVKELIGQFKSMLLENDEIELPEEYEELEALSGVKRYPVRVKCATLSWNTLEQALDQDD